VAQNHLGEEHEQMHAFAAEIMPVLQREAGGSPQLMASSRVVSDSN
jgi:hypothetical protein